MREILRTTHPGVLRLQDLVFPVYEYPHDATACWSVTGGYVYRGAKYPGFTGKYFFADYCKDSLWALVIYRRYLAGFSKELVSPAITSVHSGRMKKENSLLQVTSPGRYTGSPTRPLQDPRETYRTPGSRLHRILFPIG